MSSVYGYILWDDFCARFDTQEKINEFNDMFPYSNAPNWWFKRKEIYKDGMIISFWKWITGDPAEHHVKTRYVGIEELQELTKEQADFALANKIVILGDDEKFRNWLTAFDEMWIGEKEDL